MIEKLLIELCELAYWYAEQTGDYECREIFTVAYGDKRAIEILEEIKRKADDKHSSKD